MSDNTISNNNDMNDSTNNSYVMSVKEWVVTVLISVIPIVNIVMLFVWGFGGGTHTIKANYAKAALIVMAIVIPASFVLRMFFMGSIMGSMMGIGGINGAGCGMSW